MKADQEGIIDVIVSSTDKNFMVPVGGSIIYCTAQKNHKESLKVARTNFVQKINKFYPGRASGGPILDLFITYLQMGENQLRAMLKERKANFEYLS